MKKTPYLAYTTGWKVFVEMLQFGLVLGSILIICVISTVFAEESQTKMLTLIFSTKEGRRKDVTAKIFASFTFTVFLFLWIVVVDLAMCRIIYGLNGTDNISTVVLSGCHSKCHASFFDHARNGKRYLSYMAARMGN